MKRLLMFIVIAMMTFSSCQSRQNRTAQWGGTTEIKLEPGEKLVEVAWRNYDIWYLVEPMESDYVPKTKVFKERSNVGIYEGQVIFIERR